MSSATYRLTMRSGPTPGEIYILTGTELSIGRDTTNQITINDSEVSRRHARMLLQGDSYLFQDLGSTNGSFVNGKRLMGPRLLRPGEVITLGQNINLVYEVIQTDLDATLVTPVQPASGLSKSPESATRIESPRPVASYPPPRQVQAQPITPPPPIYAEPAQSQVEAYPSNQEESRQGISPRWIAAGCGCLAIFACLAISAFFFWIDAGGTDRWCQFFGFIFPACP